MSTPTRKGLVKTNLFSFATKETSISNMKNQNMFSLGNALNFPVQVKSINEQYDEELKRLHETRVRLASFKKEKAIISSLNKKKRGGYDY